MRPSTVAAAALAGLLLASPAFASNTIVGDPPPQVPGAARFTLFAALCLPVGEFAGTTSSVPGFARTGAGLGLECSTIHSHDIETGALVLFDRLPMDAHALETSRAAATRRFRSRPGARTPTWRVGWGLLRLGYAPAPGAAEPLRVCLAAYGGALVGCSPSLAYDPTNWIAPAAGIGADVRWHERTTIGLLYLTRIDRGGELGYDASRQPVSALHVTLGHAFGH